GVVITSVSWYHTEALRQLNDPLVYKRIIWNPHPVITLLERHIRPFEKIDKKFHAYLYSTCDQHCKPASFYLIPKIHKKPFKGRPIAADHSSVMRPLSKVISHVFNQLLPLAPTVLTTSAQLVAWM